MCTSNAAAGNRPTRERYCIEASSAPAFARTGREPSWARSSRTNTAGLTLWPPGGPARLVGRILVGARVSGSGRGMHMSGRRTPAPDELPRSDSGRIPQWVIDEAAGRPVQGTAWRAGSSPVLADSPPRRRRWLARVFTVVVVGALLAIAYLGGPRGWFGTAVADDPQSSPPPGLEEAAPPLATPPPVPDGGTGKYRFPQHDKRVGPGHLLPVPADPLRGPPGQRASPWGEDDRRGGEAGVEGHRAGVHRRRGHRRGPVPGTCRVPAGPLRRPVGTGTDHLGHHGGGAGLRGGHRR